MANDAAERIAEAVVWAAAYTSESPHDIDISDQGRANRGDRALELWRQRASPWLSQSEVRAMATDDGPRRTLRRLWRAWRTSGELTACRPDLLPQ